MIMGGPQALRKELPVSIAKQWNDRFNQYQEPAGDEIIEVKFGNVILPTRINQWTITYKPENQNYGPNGAY